MQSLTISHHCKKLDTTKPSSFAKLFHSKYSDMTFDMNIHSISTVTKGSTAKNDEHFFIF